MTTAVMTGSTIVDNIVAGARRNWRVAGYTGPREYLDMFHTVGLMTTAEYRAACQVLDGL